MDDKLDKVILLIMEHCTEMRAMDVKMRSITMQPQAIDHRQVRADAALGSLKATVTGRRLDIMDVALETSLGALPAPSPGGGRRLP